MSARVTALVWSRYPTGGGDLLLALALADQCTDAGEYIALDIPRLSKKTRQSVDTVRKQLRGMADAEWLQQMEGSKAFRISPEWVGGAPAAAPEKAAKAVRQRATRLPADWSLPEEYRAWALQEFPAWTPEFVASVAATFKDHWIAASGQNASKLDWSGTWRNWCRKSPAVPPAAAQQGGQGGTWWESSAAIDRKGAELGLSRIDGELWNQWRDRVFRAAGDGPWVKKLYKAPETSATNFKPAMDAALQSIRNITGAAGKVQ